MDQSEASHIVGLDPTLQGPSEFRAAGECEFALVPIARPSPQELVGERGFASRVWAEEDHRREGAQTGDREPGKEFLEGLILRAEKKLREQQCWGRDDLLDPSTEAHAV
jgi:hypothetical protein